MQMGAASEPAASRGEIIGIQYLRGFAALSVVVCHAAGNVAFGKYFGSPPLFAKFLSAGNVGVSLFFVISGFIISVIALDGDTIKPKLSRSVYFARRFARIIPLMWIAVLSYAALRFLGRGSFDLSNTVAALSLWPIGELEPRNIWTLRHELIFYLVFAFTFLGQGGARWLLLAWSIAPLALIAFGVPQGQGAIAQLVRMIFHGSNLQFGCGVALGLTWMTARVRPVQFRWHLPLLLAQYLGLMALTMVLTTSKPHPAVSLISITAVCAAIVATAAWLSPRKTSRVGLLLGTASYAIYLFHPHFVSATLGVWALLAPTTPVEAVVLGVSFLATGAGVLAHLLVEQPLVTFTRKLFRQTHEQPAAIAV